MKKGTIFGLGVLAGALGISTCIVFNSTKGETIFEDENMRIVTCSDENRYGGRLAYIERKNEQTQEVES